MENLQIKLYPIQENTLEIVPGKPFRKWISDHGHAARCIPLMAVNQFGWDILLDEDITVNWNGGDAKEDCVIISETGSSAVKRESHFGMGIITLSPGYTMATQDGTQLMIRTVPNVFEKEWTLLEAAIETDMLKYPWFLSIKLLNIGETTIKAGTRLARIMPVDLGSMKTAEISIRQEPEDYLKWRSDFGEYRNEVDSQVRENPKYPNVTRVYKKNNRLQRVRSPLVQNMLDTQDKSDVELWIENELLIIDDHMTPARCNIFIDAWDDYRKFSSETNDFWDDRIVNLSDVDADNVLTPLSDAGLLNKVEAHYGKKFQIYDRNIVRWQDGDSMDAHTDIMDHDNQFNHREYVAITYLNDGYEGGNTFIEDKGVSIIPSAGSTLVFRGGSIEHSVTKIKGVDRYTLVRWLEVV